MAQPYNEIIYQFKKSHSQKNLFHNKAGYKIILYTIPICKKKKKIQVCIRKTLERYRTKC